MKASRSVRSSEISDVKISSYRPRRRDRFAAWTYLLVYARIQWRERNLAEGNVEIKERGEATNDQRILARDPTQQARYVIAPDPRCKLVLKQRMISITSLSRAGLKLTNVLRQFERRCNNGKITKVELVKFYASYLPSWQLHRTIKQRDQGHRFTRSNLHQSISPFPILLIFSFSLRINNLAFYL